MRLKVFLFSIILGILLCPIFALAQVSTSTTNGNTDEIEQLNQEINKRKETIKQLEDTIKQYNVSISQKQLEAVSLKNQMGILDNRIAKMDADIQMTQEKIKQAQLEIAVLELSIKEKEQQMAKQKYIISSIVRNVHIQDQKNYLEVMMTNDNFSEFYNQVHYLENVYSDLGRSVKEMRLINEDLTVKKNQAVDKQLTYQNLKIELENKKKNLTEQVGVKQNLLVQTQSSEQRYKTLIASLKRQYQVTEGEVRSYEDEVRKRLEKQNKIKDSGSVAIDWPLNGRYITATFHDPDYPFRKVMEHSGIDVRASQGTPLYAAAAGYVGRAKRCTTAACYSYVLLVHTGELSTLYGHLSSILVQDEQFVNKGDLIGYSGGTPGTVGSGPFVTGPHLHFEVRANGIPVNPMNYLID